MSSCRVLAWMKKQNVCRESFAACYQWSRFRGEFYQQLSLHMKQRKRKVRKRDFKKTFRNANSERKKFCRLYVLTWNFYRETYFFFICISISTLSATFTNNLKVLKRKGEERNYRDDDKNSSFELPVQNSLQSFYFFTTQGCILWWNSS